MDKACCNLTFATYLSYKTHTDKAVQLSDTKIGTKSSTYGAKRCSKSFNLMSAKVMGTGQPVGDTAFTMSTRCTPMICTGCWACSAGWPGAARGPPAASNSSSPACGEGAVVSCCWRANIHRISRGSAEQGTCLPQHPAARLAPRQLGGRA